MWDSTLKGHTQNLTHSGTQSRSSNLKKSLGQNPLLVLESLLERQEVTGAHSRDKDTGRSHFEAPVLTCGHWC